MRYKTGDTIGQYEVIRRIGAGGMATVYLAQHGKLDRQVAIKVMHDTFQADEGFLARFEREAKIVASLEHPHIIPVYDYTETDGQPALIMKYVEGHSLKELLDESPFASIDDILRVMSPIADALDYAHRKGILHRDIKPSNIILDEQDIPYLADFGLARIAMAGESTLSQDSILGTPQYISPEQALGAKEIDGRTDIYSLGIILYQMIVGDVPFSSDTPYATIHHHIYSPLPQPTLVNPDVGDHVEQVLIQVLEKDPNDRFKTAGEFIIALKEAAEADSINILNPDHARQARESIAIQRETMQFSSVSSTTKPVVKKATTTTTSQIDSKSLITQYHYPFAWVWRTIGLIGFFVALILFARQLDVIDRQSSELWHRYNVSFLDQQLESYTDSLPQMTLVQARRILTLKPDNGRAYLSAAWTFLADENKTNADDLLALGVNRIESQTQAQYWLVAGDFATQAGAYDAALEYYLEAFQAAQNTSESQFVREIVWREIFNITANPDNVAIFTESAMDEYTDVRNLNAALVGALIYIANGELNEAETLLNQIEDIKSLNDDNNYLRAEYNFAWLEYYLAQDNIERAVDYGESVMNDSDFIPDWATQRIAQYTEIYEINTTSE